MTTSIAFHHFPEPEKSLNEIYRVLAPGGRLFLCDLCGEGPLSRLLLVYGRRKGSDKRYFDRATLSDLVWETGFDVNGADLIRRRPSVMLISASKGLFE